MLVAPTFTNLSSDQTNMKTTPLEKTANSVEAQSFASALQLNQYADGKNADVDKQSANGDGTTALLVTESDELLLNLSSNELSSELKKDVTESHFAIFNDLASVDSEMKEIEITINNDEQILDEDLKAMMIQQEFIPLIDSIKALLPVNAEAKELKEMASGLLPILEKIVLMKQQVGEEKIEPVLQEQLSKEQLSIFKFLESNIEKRNHIAEHYRQDASVTRTDIMNWLEAALSRYAEEDQRRIATTAITQQQAIPMSEVQQYTIHIQSLDRVDRVSEELTQKLVNIIKESRFLTKPNNLQPMNQLTVVLRPEHLGNITVRFQQVDGNMTVNMIVTSQVTKELLEANIHQLKHMFSPHQVVIERDATISDEEFFKKQQENDAQDEQEKFEQSHDSNPNGDDDDSTEDFLSFIEQFTEGGIQHE